MKDDGLIVYLDRPTFDKVLTSFFKAVGYIAPTSSIKLTKLELYNDDDMVHIEADVDTELTN